MNDEEFHSEANPADLLNQLEHILEVDHLIDEMGFIHPSQLVALSEEAGDPILSSARTVLQSTEGIVKSKESGVNLTNVVFWNRDHKLGISTAVLLPLYNAAKHAFMAALEQYKLIVLGGGNAPSFSSSNLNFFESEVMKHSRAVLLLSCDFGKAWNSRKLVLSKKKHFTAFLDELLLSALILSSSPKSECAWSHRRWVIKMISGKCTNLQDAVKKESELVEKIAEKSKMNYRAWNHRCWLVSYMSGEQVLHEFKKSRDWAGLHVADNSCFHYRTRLMLRMLEDSWNRLDPEACFGFTIELYVVWKEELDWDEMLIKRYIGREALWLHRRFLSLCWITHFARTDIRDSSCQIGHRSGISCDIDTFMDNEIQLFRSCTTSIDDGFEDCQAQAAHSTTYFLWLTKQMPTRVGFELGKKLRAREVEMLFNKAPEKTVFGIL